MAGKAQKSSNGAGPQGPLAKGQRWTASRKRDVVLRLLRGESLEVVSREIGVEIYRLEKWKDKALAGLELGLQDRKDDPLQAELDEALKRIGELAMKNDLLWERAKKKGPVRLVRSKP